MGLKRLSPEVHSTTKRTVKMIANAAAKKSANQDWRTTDSINVSQSRGIIRLEKLKRDH